VKARGGWGLEIDVVLKAIAGCLTGDEEKLFAIKRRYPAALPKRSPVLPGSRLVKILN